MARIRVSSTLFALCSVLGCASGPGVGAGVSGPFTERHAQLFDDSVDMVENPQDLSGRWREDWERELDERTSDADLIARGRVATLRTDQDLQQRVTFHLVIAIDEVLDGEHSGRELSVRVQEGAPGYASVQSHRERILDRPFVVFVRWAEDGAGGVEPRFHLSPPSAHLDRRLVTLLADKRPSTVRVIERTN